MKGLLDQYLLFRDAKNNGTTGNKAESSGFHPAKCDSCKNRIKGIRYWCLTCRNYDLCSSCEERNERETFHDEKHIFAKIKDTKTAYRAFPGSQNQGIRRRVHGNACEQSMHFRRAFPGQQQEIRTTAHSRGKNMVNQTCKYSMNARLQSLEETIHILQARLVQIETKQN